MVRYYCPKCYNSIDTRRTGDIETCTICFTTSYKSKNNIGVRVGTNDYMKEMHKKSLLICDDRGLSYAEIEKYI